MTEGVTSYAATDSPEPTAAGVGIGAPNIEEVDDVGTPWGRVAIESVLLFAMGVFLAAYFFGPTGPGEFAGLPGHDSYYHVKMAALLPEVGLVDEFPWLRFVYFTSSGKFVSHHYGFHVLLMPFVLAADALTGDYLIGGQWFVGVGMGLSLVLMNLILVAGRVRYRWIFWALLFLLPHQFFLRHCYVRAINPSLVMMLLMVWSLFTRRVLLAGVVVGLYIQVYLGAIMYAPVIVVIFVAASLWCKEMTFSEAFWLARVTFFGWLAGAILHPYSDGVTEFLWMQVFGSGLSPDIRVGREWRSYNDVWWFATALSGPLWVIWGSALLMRLRYGSPVDARTLTLVVLKFVFLVLTLKARRFVEYWPVFALLSAAYLVAPGLYRISRWRERLERSPHPPSTLEYAGVAVVVAAVSLGVSRVIFKSWFVEWATDWRMIAVIVCGVAAAYVSSAGFGKWSRALALSLPLMVFVSVAAGRVDAFRSTHRSAQSKFDLYAIDHMMREVKSQSEAGDLIFTDDWDVFPVFFYFNHHNHYAVGLDPKFTQNQRPDLWERYVRVTRGEVPHKSKVKMRDEKGRLSEQTIDVKLTDLRDHFQARFVICDREHRSLAKKLLADKALAERIYPNATLPNGKMSPYTLFRIRAENESVPPP